MHISISGQHLDVTDAIRDYTESKLDRLTRHSDSITRIEVVLRVEKPGKSQASIHVAGADLHAASEHDDMYASLDLLADKLIVNYSNIKRRPSHEIMVQRSIFPLQSGEQRVHRSSLLS